MISASVHWQISQYSHKGANKNELWCPRHALSETMGTAFNIIWCMIMRTQVDWITPCAWPGSFQKVVYFCNMGIMLWPVAVRKATWSLISRTRTDTDPSVHLCNKRAQHTRGWDQVHLHSRETERRIESYVICDGMVTHTRNLCSAFNPSKMHTHTVNTHPEQWAAIYCAG